ncbi:MAG: hypothetical protein UX85_C0002G0042 [Candidatus Beckwithbacteria bacterium GW2011_GWB1_47_15]|uniref:Uncharacterized protein n=1 Tax=Candidatus Beckwithbacteria bacterium GW2011_GWB1_47_15 TaxID=1618371 RepID=A0A0G1RX04_9BACT|nr:MAG: hypothetical protein UY43_C0001G0630 [Candidatus Beckwithbacteria bacterium GW2011_GWC1_49_16]KKU35608.1 MAG: hypothetical protein UX50_C0002G0035 [Candidatus Beckwithbacteria bacterium GW2011_GWA1_46_30]KKU61662.1 MAG: hypothetical protein UX85_C0002G0042 [Candidatus Beckwithbacteria bacterium GW2011_GWB1_47_15]KKU72165.1 MAG: hypothetical protein UX97_C0001G0035 [Candidatus Beckwithbacteria bacterium GW2011_GWA2_47_25]KKW04790.1 MAG: hypothetical protein UY37_C0002G0043 [Candidatus Be
MTQEQKKLYQLIDKKCRTLIMVCFSLLLVLTVARMVSANRTATWGNKLEEIEYQTGLTRAENLKLKSQLAEKTGGLNQLTRDAENKGFVQNPEVKYFAPVSVVAQSQP